MNIIAYQIDKDYVCRFIYTNDIISLKVGSFSICDGMMDFLFCSGGEILSDDVDIYDYMKNIYTQRSILQYQRYDMI